MSTSITLNAAELATVLAALRWYQATGMIPADYDSATAAIHDIATNAGEVLPLDADAIDTLCERINCTGNRTVGTRVYVLSTCIPSEGRPCFPSVFSSQAEAEAEADKMMREAWTHNAPYGDDDELLPYPGDWREAQDEIVNNRNGDSEIFGEYEITGHEIDMPETAGLRRLTVVMDGGTVQSVLTDCPALVGIQITTIDYDTDGGDRSRIVPVPQDGGGTEDACVFAAAHVAEDGGEWLKAALAVIDAHEQEG